MSDSNRVQMRYVEEDDWGTTPPTRDLQELRIVSESLKHTIENVTSNEIRDDRQTTNLIQTGSSAAGDLAFELSYDSYDEFLEGALWSDWSVDLAISAATIAAAATGFTDSGAGFGSVVAGEWIKVAGFTGSSGENEGYYLVTAAAAATLTTSPAPASIEAVGATVTVKGSYLRNGTTEHSYSIERKLSELSPLVHFPYTGLVVNTFNVDVASKAVLTGSFGFIGQKGDVSATAMSSGSITDAGTTDPLNANANVANVLENDTAVATCLVNAMGFALNNNVRGLDAIGSTGNCDIGVGEVDLTGTLTAYFKNKDLYQKFLDATASSLSFRVADAAGNVYIFTFHNIKFSDDAPAAGGANTDIMDNLAWTALRHATYDCMIQIDKFAA